MTQIINPDEPPKFKKAVDGKELSTETSSSQITNNDDEDVLKNESDNDEDQGEPLPVKELKEDLEDEDKLDEQAETSGVL
ncbi:MAG: hypothetical protein WKF85_09015 [Chitinophagaceae bacterium]